MSSVLASIYIYIYYNISDIIYKSNEGKPQHTATPTAAL